MAVLERSGYERARQRNRRADLLLRRGAKSQHAILRRDPQHAVAILQHRLRLRTDRHRRQVVSANVTDQAFGGPNPETSIACRTQTFHSTEKRGVAARGAPVKEAHAVESDETVSRRHPEIPITSLSERVDERSRDAVFTGP